MLAAGVALNSLVVVAFGLRAWRRGDRGSSLRSVFSAKYRKELGREHPTLMRDTLILSAAVIVPYLLLIAIVFEPSRSTA